jgi:amino-acid N-acetyltransferase
METKPAGPGDWPAVRGLLTEAGLPLDGAAEAFSTGIVARDGQRVIGCAAIELYGHAALLRSVAVSAHRRGGGVGIALVDALEAIAADGGASEVILLTETATTWFAGLGYDVIDRSDAPADVASSVEFETACSSPAVAMRRALT